MEKKNQIAQQLRELIAKSNLAINSPQNRQKTVAYIYLILSLLSLSFFGIFAIGPTLSTISTLQKQYEEREQVLDDLRRKNSSLQSLGVAYREIEPNINLVTNAIPMTPRIPDLARKIEIISARNNVVLSKLDFGVVELYPATNPTSKIFSFTFSLSIDGNEANVNAFIKDLVNLDRIINIDRLNTAEAQRGRFVASITGRAYFYKE